MKYTKTFERLGGADYVRLTDETGRNVWSGRDGDENMIITLLNTETAPLLARIAELEAALGQLRNIATQSIADKQDISADWLLIFAEDALKAGGNE